MNQLVVVDLLEQLVQLVGYKVDISSSYAKILGETNFHAREIPRSG